jgi:hypothetical protein
MHVSCDISGPLKDIRQSIADLATANMVVTGYINQVHEASQTFSFYYTKGQTQLGESLARSSRLITGAMTNAIEVLKGC